MSLNHLPPPPALARAPIPEGPFDLAVIGGGINGAGIARDAVLRGLSVCLLEKDDFGSGTSSASSKMLHGGMRYLEQLELGLVFEALRERALQLRLAPHLVRSQTFLIPVYEGARRGPRMVRLGIFLYDLLALGRRLGRGAFLDAAAARARVPGILESGLLGAGLYFDGVMDDARLCLANVLDAAEAAAPGQLAARNYAEVLTLRETSPLEIEVRDRVRNETRRVLARWAVRAVGPWTDLGPLSDGPPLLVPSKGAHLVLPPLEASPAHGPHGLLLTHAEDGRVFFIIPWREKTLVGTTETPFAGDPGRLRVEPEDVDYLLAAAARLFPGRSFHRRDILGAFAGVRPLARSRFSGAGTGRVSRRHRIVDGGRGVLTVVGGKYTTYRAVARQVLDRIAPGRPCLTHRRPLHGGEAGGWEAYRAGRGGQWCARFGDAQVRTLFSRYGARLEEVLRLIDGDPELGDAIGPGVLRAEAVHAVLREAACYPADVIARRTDLRYSAGNGREGYAAVEEAIRRHGGAAGAIPADLDGAREAFFASLAWEDGLRGLTAAEAATMADPARVSFRP
jgi:glycerol-3-phosphate dehydrogenase